LWTGRWFSPVSSTNETDRHDITEILLKVALSIIIPNQANITDEANIKKYILINKTSIAPPLFIDVSVPMYEDGQLCVCVLGTPTMPLVSVILLLNFGPVLMV
jgi:hypothetical protein